MCFTIIHVGTIGSLNRNHNLDFTNDQLAIMHHEGHIIKIRVDIDKIGLIKRHDISAGICAAHRRVAIEREIIRRK